MYCFSVGLHILQGFRIIRLILSYRELDDKSCYFHTSFFMWHHLAIIPPPCLVFGILEPIISLKGYWLTHGSILFSSFSLDICQDLAHTKIGALVAATDSECKLDSDVRDSNMFLLLQNWVRKHIHVKNIILRSVDFPNITQLKIWASHCISQWQMKMLHLHHGWPKTSRFFSAMKTLAEAASNQSMEPWRFGSPELGESWTIYFTIPFPGARLVSLCHVRLPFRLSEFKRKVHTQQSLRYHIHWYIMCKKC